MRNSAFEQKVAAIEALRNSEPGQATIDALRKALKDRNNYAVSKAAAVTGALGLSQLVPDLLAAFDRFFTDPAKTDPQCWAKKAISRALADLGHDHSRDYLRGLAHIQMEPVWGGAEDTAGALRAACAFALISCRDINDLDLLTHFTDRLADTDKTVRAEVARAIGNVGNPLGALLLRLKALTGDPDPEVLGACFSAMLSLDATAAMAFVKRFLGGEEEVASEAAIALALTHQQEALDILTERVDAEVLPASRRVFIAAIALTRLDAAVDYLIGIVESGGGSAENALEALASIHPSDEVCARILGAVRNAGSTKLQAAFARHFGKSAAQ